MQIEFVWIPFAGEFRGGHFTKTICSLARLAHIILQGTKWRTSPARPCDRFRMTQILHSAVAAVLHAGMMHPEIRAHTCGVYVRVYGGRVCGARTCTRNVASAKLDTARRNFLQLYFLNRERSCARKNAFTWVIPAGCIYDRTPFAFRGSRKGRSRCTIFRGTSELFCPRAHTCNRGEG